MKGQQQLQTNSSGYNGQDFFVQQMLNTINTAEPVTVTSVSNEGGLAPAGTVTVRPLVNLVDGEGQGHGQSELFQLPYLRIQGGENALVIDPKPGDMGLAVYAMRDTEAVKETRGQAPANPGSARAYSKGDGFYLGGFLNALPKRYLMIEDEGLTLDDGEGGVITMKSGKISITAPAGLEINAPGGITATAPTEKREIPQVEIGTGDASRVTVHGDLKVDGYADADGGMSDGTGHIRLRNGHLDVLAPAGEDHQTPRAKFSGDIANNGKVTSQGDQVAGGISQIHHTHPGVSTGSGSTEEPQ